MIVLHYPKKKVYVVKIGYESYPILINGEMVPPNKKELVVASDHLKIQRVKSYSDIVKYMHRESRAYMSFSEYKMVHDSYFTIEDDERKYKSLEDEFACRKMELDYIPIMGERVELEDIRFAIEEIVDDDDPAIKPLYQIGFVVGSKNDCFLFKYNKHDLIARIAREILTKNGYKEVESVDEKTKGNPQKEFSIGKPGDYRVISFPDNPYFSVDSGGQYKAEYIDSYSNIMAEKRRLKKDFSARLGEYIENHNVTVVRNSALKEVEKSTDLIYMMMQKPKLNRLAILGELAKINRALDLKAL